MSTYEDKLDEVCERWYCGFYDRFEDLCVINNYSIQTVSKMTRISPATISQWQAYRDSSTGLDALLFGSRGSNPGIDSIIKLSVCFNCSSDYLIGLRVNWKAEQLNRVFDQLSDDNQIKVQEFAAKLLREQQEIKTHLEIDESK